MAAERAAERAAAAIATGAPRRTVASEAAAVEPRSGFRQTRTPNAARKGRVVCRCSPTLADLGQTRPVLDQLRTEPGQIYCPMSAELQPSLANFGPNSTKYRPRSAKFTAPMSTSIGRCAAGSGRRWKLFGLSSANFGPICHQIRADFDQRPSLDGYLTNDRKAQQSMLASALVGRFVYFRAATGGRGPEAF